MKWIGSNTIRVVISAVHQKFDPIRNCTKFPNDKFTTLLRVKVIQYIFLEI